MPPQSPPFRVRRATTADVVSIRELIRPYVESNILLGKELVGLYEAVQEFRVAEHEDGEIIGCGALHVLWRDLGEIRTIATSERRRGLGAGGAILDALLEEGRRLGLERLFCLTFETGFFGRRGFVAVPEHGPDGGRLVDEETYRELLRSPDVGIQEFLDMPWAKPNTLGNTRMILDLRA